MNTYCSYCCVWGDHQAPECQVLDAIRNPEKHTLRMKMTGHVNCETGVISATLTDISDNLTKFVVETREQIIRDGLIRLGWTPPPE